MTGTRKSLAVWHRRNSSQLQQNNNAENPTCYRILCIVFISCFVYLTGSSSIPLEYGKAEVQTPCHPWFHLWSYQRILRIKNCRTPWDDWLFRHFIYSVRQSWWRLADSNRRPPACEAGALTSGARRTGRKPCGARLSIAFSTACSLRLSNPERLRPLLLSYRLIMLLSILLDNTEQLQLFSIIFHHPTATWKNTPHLCIILKSSPKKFKHSAVIWESASATIRP